MDEINELEEHRNKVAQLQADFLKNRNTQIIGLVKGLKISTIYTEDYGWETAVIDSNSTYPVQRYNNSEQAKEGHEIWCEKAKTIKEANVLGTEALGCNAEDELVTLER